MSKLKYLLLSLFLVSVFSCIKDELSFKPKDFDDVSIEGLEKSYTIENGSTLKIEPIITTKFGTPNDQYDYIWYTYADAPGGMADTISKEKNLDVVINRVVAGIPHYINLKVVNKKDKTFTLKRAELNTTSHFSAGIVALVKNDNVMDLSFIKNGTDNVENNLFSSANNGKTLSSTSFSVRCIDACEPQPGVYRRIVVATNDQDIAVNLTPDTFVEIETLNGLFFQPQQFPDKKLNYMGNDQYAENVVIGNKMYDRQIDRYSGDVTPNYNSALLCAVPPTDIDLAPYVLQPTHNAGSPVVFDNNGGRFMYRDSDSPTFSFFVNSADGTAFDFFDPGKLSGMTMMSGGYYDDDPGKMWMLMDDSNTNSRRILALNYSVDEDWNYTLKTEGNREISRSSAPVLYTTDKYISASSAKVGSSGPWVHKMTGISNAFFYIVNNKLYIYHITNDFEVLLVDGDREGFTIDNIAIHTTDLLDSEGKKAEFVRLGLAIRDKQGSGKKGGVAYYKVNFLGGISATQYFKKTGFCDQVISFDEKIN